MGTSDPAAARSFYGELIGWTADVCRLRHRAGWLELEPAADTDKEAAVAFYGAVFDWRLQEHPDWGAGTLGSHVHGRRR